MSLIRESDSAPYALLVTMLAGLALAWTLADDPVKVTVEGPRVQFEPGYVRLRVTVAPDARNRGLWMGLADGEYVAASSYEQLEGAKSAKTRWREFKDMGAGDYTVFAVIERNDGTRDEARATVQVLCRSC